MHLRALHVSVVKNTLPRRHINKIRVTRRPRFEPEYSVHLRALHASVVIILLQTDHAFDLVLPKISPPAHTSYHDVERFLALMAVLPTSDNYEKVEGKPEVSHELAASMS